ncbi:hypothetical protein EDF52_10274 [Curtobacterium sp. PhB42]|nr:MULTISPECIES: hypothetical protein [unclassified Curtobacterium]TDW50986.1 hypothetical protein EDF52_10274 [Curtobacterium sp. PhB42]TDW56168.1 hypothetical protein EDF47_104279 [Curtobacterium sp. PhB190]
MSNHSYPKTSRPTWDEVLAESARLIDDFITQRQQWPLTQKGQNR